MLKKILGFAPKLEADGSYSPSKMALKMGVSKKTDFENITYKKYEGEKSKILVIFTEEKNLKMKNGKYFSTGNHPVEALLPMLHLKNAGFDFEIATPTGKPVAFEMWAFPKEDENVTSIYNELKVNFETPISLTDFVNTSFNQTDKYAAVFVPGGHGGRSRLRARACDRMAARVLTRLRHPPGHQRLLRRDRRERRCGPGCGGGRHGRRAPSGHEPHLGYARDRQGVPGRGRGRLLLPAHRRRAVYARDGHPAHRRPVPEIERHPGRAARHRQ